MIEIGRLRTAALLAVVTLLSLPGCSAADRAVLGAPRCAEAAGAPVVPAPTPGTVYAIQPHFAGVAGKPPAPPAPPGPQPVPGWTDVVSVASTGHTSYAVKADGSVWVYGLGHQGSLGDGITDRHFVEVPQPVPGITDGRSVHVVGGAAFVVRRDGTVLGWGNGQLASGGRRSPAEPDIPPRPRSTASTTSSRSPRTS